MMTIPYHYEITPFLEKEVEQLKKDLSIEIKGDTYKLKETLEFGESEGSHYRDMISAESLMQNDYSVHKIFVDTSFSGVRDISLQLKHNFSNQLKSFERHC